MSGSTSSCMHCGAEVWDDATFCRECGASEDSGWNDASDALALGGYSADEEEERYDYEQYVRNEFPEYLEDSDISSRRILTTLLVIAVCLALGIGLLL